MPKKTCAFLGPEGTYSHQASLSLFPDNILIPHKTIKSLLSSHEDFLLIPLENSTFGTVSETLDNLFLTTYTILTSTILPITHCLLSKSSQIETIYSHAEALGQCSEYLQEYYPHTKLIRVSSTAQGAYLASTTPNSGAIASKVCSRLFNLKVIKEGISPLGNQTRFIVMSREMEIENGGDEVTLLSFQSNPEKLSKSLEIVARLCVFRVDSRPLQEW